MQLVSNMHLVLQPYRESTLKKNGVGKLEPQYNGPFRIIKHVGEVAYELKLSAENKVHNIFHVSHLKKELGYRVVPFTIIPSLDDEGKLILVPEAILYVWEKWLRRQVIKEYLIKGKDLLVDDAIWEDEDIL